MAEYSRSAKGSFTAGGTSATIYLPFQPTFVELWNLTNIGNAVANSKTCRAWWDSNASFTPSAKSAAQTMVEMYSSAGALIFDTVANPNGISSFGLLGSTNAGLELQFGPQVQIVAIPKASPTVIEVSGAAGFAVGQVVILEGLFQSSTTGMPQMSNMPFVITAIGTNGGNQTITVLWNSNQSSYTALSGTPTGAFVRQVLFPWNYLPGVNFISAITTGTTTTVTTTSNHNFVVGQEIAFRIPSTWGITQLNSLPNNVIPGSPVYGYVTSITSNTIFVCSINSTGYTAFNSNPTVAQTVAGLTPPQVLAVGDINSGGVAYSGGALYPSPVFPTSSGGISTINGPAISGAFVNNTAQGFVIGSGTAQQNAAGTIMTTSDIIMWRAYLSDYSNP